jgi:hypothetical protein
MVQCGSFERRLLAECEVTTFPRYHVDLGAFIQYTNKEYAQLWPARLAISSINYVCH